MNKYVHFISLSMYYLCEYLVYKNKTMMFFILLVRNVLS